MANAVSPECWDRLHSACNYEDCACNCHTFEEIMKDALIVDAIEREEKP